MDEPSHEEFDAWLRRRQLPVAVRDPAALRNAVWRRIRQAAHEAEVDRHGDLARLGVRFEHRLTASLVAASLALIAVSALTGVAAGIAIRPDPDFPGFETIRRPPELLRPPERDWS